MLSGVKNNIMNAAIALAQSAFKLAGNEQLHSVGQRFIHKSGIGLGAYPVGFSPDEIEFYHPDAASQFDEVNDYEIAMCQTGSGNSDNFPKRGRYLMLHQCASLALDRFGEQGDVAECGCWRGHSTYMLARLMERKAISPFHVFDSFEGLSEYTAEDRGGLAPKTTQDAETRRRHFTADFDAVRETLAEFDFIQLYKGWIPDRFPAVEDRQFKLVHVDVDLYHPYVDSIEFFYPRLLDGGVMVFDDYASAGFPGARKAVDRLAQRFNPSLTLAFPLSGSVWIK